MQIGQSSFEENQDYIGFLSPANDSLNEQELVQKKRKLNDASNIEEGEEPEQVPVKRFVHTAPASTALPSKRTFSAPSQSSTKPAIVSLKKQYTSLISSDVPWLLSYFKPRQPNNDHDAVQGSLPEYTNRLGLYEYTSLPAIRQLHEEIAVFGQFISPTEKEKMERRACVDRIRTALQSVWPNAKVILRIFINLFFILFIF